MTSETPNELKNVEDLSKVSVTSAPRASPSASNKPTQTVSGQHHCVRLTQQIKATQIRCEKRRKNGATGLVPFPLSFITNGACNRLPGTMLAAHKRGALLKVLPGSGLVIQRHEP